MTDKTEPHDLDCECVDCEDRREAGAEFGGGAQVEDWLPPGWKWVGGKTPSGDKAR